jgi:hypothetical protein
MLLSIQSASLKACLTIVEQTSSTIPNIGSPGGVVSDMASRYFRAVVYGILGDSDTWWTDVGEINSFAITARSMKIYGRMKKEVQPPR